MSLFSTPKINVPGPDPAVTAATTRAQNQADQSLTLSIQDNLRRMMQARLQTFGLVPNAPSQSPAARPAVTSGFMSSI